MALPKIACTRGPGAISDPISRGIIWLVRVKGFAPAASWVKERQHHPDPREGEISSSVQIYSGGQSPPRLVIRGDN